LKDGEKKDMDLVGIFLKEEWGFVHLQSYRVSDQVPRFIFTFWNAVVKALDIMLKMSSLFDPQMDGQIDSINQTFEWYLSNACNYK
jgi:hypothetical protein